LNIGVDADAHIVACRRLDLTLKPIGLRVGDNAGQAPDCDGGEPVSAHGKYLMPRFGGASAGLSVNNLLRTGARSQKTRPNPIEIALALNLSENAR
jgi:hypothetical protein